MSAKPRIQTNWSGLLRLRNWPIIRMPSASCPSMKCSSNKAMRSSRRPGFIVYWRSSVIGQHISTACACGCLAPNPALVLDMYLAPSLEMQSPNGLATVMITTPLRFCCLPSIVAHAVRIGPDLDLTTNNFSDYYHLWNNLIFASPLVLVSGAKWNPLHKPLQPIGDDSFDRFGAQMASFPR